MTTMEQFFLDSRLPNRLLFITFAASGWNCFIKWMVIYSERKMNRFTKTPTCAPNFVALCTGIVKNIPSTNFSDIKKKHLPCGTRNGNRWLLWKIVKIIARMQVFNILDCLHLWYRFQLFRKAYPALIMLGKTGETGGVTRRPLFKKIA